MRTGKGRLRGAGTVRGRWRKPHYAPRTAHASGFSLLEVLVAFAILALTLGVLLQIFQRAMTTTATSAEYSRIVALAESKLAAVGGDIPLEEGVHTGEPEQGMDWIVSIQPFQPEGWLGEDPAPTLQPFLVTAVASLPTISGARQVTLRSVQLAEPYAPGL
ncbi:prepilin-type N-terminal cleavage/methylation domain-containing protein [Thiohalocapsa sp.]|uniref:type IV pilus modification PilV family protein n=1 Tax=Thiohalocapsa sp. TaxID=2497641 RepID=UPI0025FDF4A4|nr:prepilin-type N-terminal cleavage/methylation domain-containing protein [Thiohalocapsa sp.]